MAAVVAMASACGDDGGMADTGLPPGDGGMGDADTSVAPDAMADATPDAAGDAGGDGGVPSCTEDDLGHLLVVTTAADFSRAGLGVLTLSDLTTVAGAEDLPDTDSAPASAFCQGYVLSRGAGEAMVMDASDPTMVARTIDVDPAGSMGPYASNPQTIVAAGPNEAYVVAQAQNAVTIIDPQMGAVIGEIDLSGYLKSGDMDGVVDASDAIIVGERLYVALGNYFFDASFAIHFQGSELAVIDLSTRMPVDMDDTVDGLQGIDLAGENPWRGLQHDAATDILYVGTTGDNFAIDGQIEAVDLGAATTMGVVVSESDLSAEINGFSVVSPSRVLVLAGTDLVSLNPAEDTITPVTVASEIDGLYVHRGTVWAWARGGSSPGLASFDAVTGDETTPAAGRFTFGDLPVLGVVAVP